MEIRYVPTADVIRLKNIREGEQNIEELAQSMQENGLKIEIHVYPSEGKYVLMYGSRRLAAAKKLGWTEIRAIIEEPPENEGEFLLSQFIENSQREELNYLEKARVYKRLVQVGYSQVNVASKFGISKTEVSQAISSLNMPEELQDALNEGRISPSAIEPLISLPKEEQKALAHAAIRTKTVRGVKKLVAAHRKKKALEEEKNKWEIDVPTEADPFELIAIEELNEAIEHVTSVSDIGFTHPDLIRKARLKVETLLQKTAILQQYLNGSTWEDVSDLV